LILVRYLPHGQKLVDMLRDLPVFFVNGRLDGETRRQVKEQFEGGEFHCLVASSVFDIGVDIPSLDSLVLAGGGKSTVRVLQRIGRVIRAHEGKTDAIVMDFIDNAKYLDTHSAIRIAVYEAEPRFRLKFPSGFDRGSLKRIRRLKAKIG
jgi:superfamily II DNA or RNA helicase